MKFKRMAKVEAGLRQIDIAPLIDCLFLLLIFFMLTSSFIATTGINVKLPEASAKDEMGLEALTVVISSEDIIYLEGKPLIPDEVESILKKKKYSSLSIKADRDASLGAVVQVWDSGKRAGIENIGIAATYQE
ncbi:MAG: biopolymer transporter ExbD [Candidatus Omnitrophica bacterium]|nr:biopolymer transporter ExbD [Candidatus Omnitrophota bacterium]MBU0896591.1 biopolymer transporter ExbD [Candidatus Omnitrophota bacterium]MBU1523814.1 biopolymer transporter ExbD [Candidatus Omnitrophota bacterium]MBU2436598.1 biopolymer transporter ExbD [Candidatus Omnitrophota bacterium]